MLILMKNDHSENELDHVCEKIKKMGLEPHVIPGETSVAVGITGNRGALDRQDFVGLPGVADAIRVTKPFKLVSRTFNPKNTEIQIGKLKIGAEQVILMAGPCSIESHEQTHRIAKAVKTAGAHVLRGGAFKPRTSPYAFQGLGEEGLKIMQSAGKENDMPIITEAIDLPSLEKVYEYADVIQIGARNMQNYSLLSEAGKLDKPVMLKRGLSATIDEWLQAAEYLMAAGNKNVILCERGVRSFDSYTRNLLDLAAVPLVKELTHLPIVVDPSHGTGKRNLIPPAARGAMAIGADGLMIEVHDRPEEALSDGPQALLPEMYQELLGSLKLVAESVGRKI